MTPGYAAAVLYISKKKISKMIQGFQRSRPCCQSSKQTLCFFGMPRHALVHPSQDEVISESLLSSLDVRSHAAAQWARMT